MKSSCIRTRFFRLSATVLLLLASGIPGAVAAERNLSAGESLQAAIDTAAAGDVLHLAKGVHHGPVTIDKPLALVGEPGAVLVGNDHGSVITITSPDARVAGLTIRGSGLDLPKMDSAVLVRRTGLRATVTGNRMENNLFGVYLHGAAGSIVKDNVIVGRTDLRMSEAGNGVSIWNAPGAEIVGNDFRNGRDGIFVTTSKNNVFRDNSFRDLRFAIHYMYTNSSQVIGNRSQNDHIAWAIMYSRDLEIRDNVSIGDRDHGLMLNYTNDSLVTGNVVREGGKKCLFIYNAHKNRIEGNHFVGCPIGIHFTAGSERNVVVENAFIGNRTQVKYVGTRLLDWGEKGRGNYWSDNPAFDLDGDGIGDRAYRPNGVMDQLLWKYPQAKILVNSPAVELIRWAQARFPAIRPGGVIDSTPLMQPPVVGATLKKGARP
ncbi:nitrous oxide reductase family maturation protein NosD [Aestuariispira ectoiniformans]|uniref:nitrous oxide reductase family maturation protein NosD n=1 Tax=Aestuariispira ectoiniformans TaxID=2775080 RepID=UPI00223AD443|nr:nitrous oxide reductase family maturation protein NosD [Aestuariispira ectoiniformans]